MVLGWTVASSATGYDDYPPGSYQQSCRDLRMSGNRLYARCQDTGGRWHDTSLRDVDHCTGEINNINGRLDCSRSVNMPGGTFTATCKDVRMRYNVLYARCRNRDGHWVDTSLSNYAQCQSAVENIDGQLSCGGQPGYYDSDRDRNRDYDRDHDYDRDRDQYGRLPGGSYTQTCRDIHIHGNAIQADCQTMDGDWRNTSLDHINQCVGDIVNDNGRLECTRRGGRTVPRGSYTDTCRDIYVNGDKLRARCQTADGGWRWSQLDDWDDCRGGIVNYNGQLTCRRDRDDD